MPLDYKIVTDTGIKSLKCLVMIGLPLYCVYVTRERRETIPIIISQSNVITKKDAFRKFLKKHFDSLTGNKHLSLKDWDGDKIYVAYLFHENCDIGDLIYNKGFSEEYLREATEINIQVKDRIKKNTPSKIVEEATLHFYNQEAKPCNYAIFRWIMLRLRDNGDWLPNKFQMERWIFRIQANLMDEKGFNNWMNTMYEQWFGMIHV